MKNSPRRQRQGNRRHIRRQLASLTGPWRSVRRRITTILEKL